MGWPDAVYDRCGCGRRKEASEYVCAQCYETGQYEHQHHKVCGLVPPVRVVDGKGEFDRGVFFDASQFGLTRNHRYEITTLSLGYWPEGMVVEHNGKRYTVRGRQEEPQWLEMEA